MIVHFGLNHASYTSTLKKLPPPSASPAVPVYDTPGGGAGTAAPPLVAATHVPNGTWSFPTIACVVDIFNAPLRPDTHMKLGAFSMQVAPSVLLLHVVPGTLGVVAKLLNTLF